MNFWDKAQLGAQFARAGLAWWRRDTAYPSPVPHNPTFKTPRDALRLIRDGDVLAVSGLGAHQRAAILYWAIGERFDATGHPADLTVINLGGHGGRGVAPGTIEELARPGLCTRLISSHFETMPAFLDLAATGDCTIHCVPLGVIALLYDALARGRDTVLTTTGVGTFLDPRGGRGTPLADGTDEQLVTRVGTRLRYRIPKPDVVIFNLPAADRRGNLYATHAAMIGDSAELARAARRNGGRVIANVGRIDEPGAAPIFLPADLVDAVVFHPDTEQTGAVFHRAPWLDVTPDSEAPIERGLERVRFVNSLIPTIPRRSAADLALGRLGAATLLANVPAGASVSIGTGLPEEVSAAAHAHGLLDRVTFLVESGTIGGLPVPGAYFGAALHPQRIVSPAELFKCCARRLDATCLGALQVDGDGNVNVSKRGEGLGHYVGPGGFIDFTEAARTIIFVTSWMHRGEVAVENGRIRIVRRGAPKFVEHVDEVTFNGPRALTAGKRVWYVTHVGLFRLTARGVELAAVMPGIDVRRDILRGARMPIVLPRSGRVPRLPRGLVTGDALPLGRAWPASLSARAAR
jgi:propionate CoA-transferase